MCAEWYWVSLLSMKISGSPPRARGRPLESSVMLGTAGSSPHARGRPGRLGVHGHGPGITPACAGKTFLPYVY